MELNGRDLVKYFIGQTPFSGRYEEELEDIISIYEDMFEMCDVFPGQKRKAVGIMLEGSAKKYFVNHVRHARTFEEAFHLLRKRYNKNARRIIACSRSGKG